ncbi:ATP-binding protein [Arcanobacterium phocae]|uniref:ATP-binding protein n=1 Tax=Arcanobacterium phocae TaxID=131112 RepID=UPI001C0F8178|nr:ATP-binding protein [Arcanobacterium phocae]
MRWTVQELENRLNGFRKYSRDTTDIEVKQASELPDNLSNTVCAFANMPEGGTIILGVAENQDFAITGVGNAQELFDQVVQQTRNRVVPAPQLEHQILTVDDKDVLIVEVVPVALKCRPVKASGIAYLRQSDGDFRMNESDLALIEIQKLSLTDQYRFDVAPVTNSNVKDLDSGRIKNFLSEIRASSARLAKVGDDQTLLHMLNIVTEEGQLTLAGLYALGVFPQAKAPQLRITAAVTLSSREAGVRSRNRRDFDGALPDLLEDALAWVEANAPRQSRYSADGNMRDECVYPLVAVRELIANALVHRDLSPNTEGKWVEIRLREDRLVISNPGGLRGVSVEQLQSDTLAKNAVNPRLYDLAKKIHSESGNNVIEGEGSGVQEVFRVTRQALLPKPSLQDTGVQFTAILYAKSVFSPDEVEWLAEVAGNKTLTATEKLLLVKMRHGQKISRMQISKEFAPISLAEVDRILRRLIELNMIVLVADGGKTAAYGLVEQLIVRPHLQDKAALVSSVHSRMNIDMSDIVADSRRVTKNGPVIVRTLRSASNGMTFDGLLQHTGLSEGQVRYAIKLMREAGLITQVGGWGVRDTKYYMVEDNAE